MQVRLDSRPMNSNPQILSRKAFLFLSARWEHLILASYAVEAEMLADHLPTGLEPDTLDGKAFVSFVAFRFLNTRVLGVKIPLHIDFPEINLRYYVKLGGQRGVCFIREIVPHSTTAWAARTLYNEPYVALPLYCRIKTQEDRLTAEYGVKHAGRTHSIRVVAENRPYLPKSDSLAHYFKEHEWGFGRTRTGKTLGYRVVHPHWNVYPLTSYRIDVDFAALYGPKWAVLNGAEPFNVTLAQGSPVKVYSPYSAIV